MGTGCLCPSGRIRGQGRLRTGGLCSDSDIPENPGTLRFRNTSHEYRPGEHSVLMSQAGTFATGHSKVPQLYLF